MNVLIIEDEFAAARRLSQMIISIRPSWKISDVLESVEDAIHWFRTHPQPDLVFSDIQLADGIAFEIYPKVELSCPVIFTTAFDNYAIQAFKLNSIDYLLKPIVEDQLLHAVRKFENLQMPSNHAGNLLKLAEDYLSSQQQNASDRILVKYGQKLKAISPNEMAYFYIDGRNVMLRTKDGNTYPVDETLDQLEQVLNKRTFFRVNRQSIVTFDAIKDMIVYSKSRIKLVLEPATDLEIIVSGNRSSEFKNWLKGSS